MVKIRNVYKFFGQLKALDNVSLDIYDGEKMVIVGPSGSGKSTLLRSINKLETIDAGQIIVDGFDISNPETNINKVREEIGMVFQLFNVFPHKTVLENINLAQTVVRKRSKKEATEISKELLIKVGILEKANEYPGKLSGGQQQRVAIARALAMKPKLMLFDEP
ncbi:MAG: ATP-binding cassette domain-containing protein, partial [Thermodesulfobacteriota bacterium]|nr:ATP-binding cassette domain-containing protein [Thermodesulfobacteriota bacterium]